MVESDGSLQTNNSLNIVANGNVPIISGNGGYIPSGLRFIDTSYTQPGQINEWAIWKGNTWLKGLGFMRYDAVNRCSGGICDVSLFLADNGNIGVGGNISPRYPLDINGHTSINGYLYLQGSDLRLGMGDGKNQGNILEQRALVHGDGDDLWVNFLGDFEGGTRIGKGVYIKNTGDSSYQGKLEAKEIKVTTTPTADFVFADSYNLPTLEDVEKHIKQKRHLPEIASAKEMEKEGVNIGEFQIKLLQKIEELTLYSIEQNKKIKELEDKIEKLVNK